MERTSPEGSDRDEPDEYTAEEGSDGKTDEEAPNEPRPEPHPGVTAPLDHVTDEERVAFAIAALDAGARLDNRDDILKSTPLGWACRWGREELVRLFLARGADPIEPDAESWARPLAWAEKKGHDAIATILKQHRQL